MNRKLLTVAILASSLVSAVQAHATPIYIGLQEAGVNGGAIMQEANGNGSSSITNLTFGTFSASASVTGTPLLKEPNLLSNTVDVSSKGAGVLKIYVSETNQFPTSFSDFESGFTDNLQFGPIASVTESTYVHQCAVRIPGQSCNATTDVFAMGTLLSTKTFTMIGAVDELAAVPSGLTGPYATTEVYTITATGAGGAVNDTINLTTVPEPASLALLVSGMLGLGMIRRRRASIALISRQVR